MRHLPVLILPLLLLSAVPPQVRAEQDGPQDVRALLDGVMESRGGAALLSRLIEIRRSGTLVLPKPDGERRQPLELVVRPPDYVRLSVGTGDNRIVMVMDGARLEETRGTGAPGPLDTAGRRSLRRTLQMDEAFIATRIINGKFESVGLSAAGPGALPADLQSAGTAVNIGAAGTDQVQLVVPRDGGLPSRMDYTATGNDDQQTPMSDVFGDWRVVRGLLFPFEVMSFIDGRGALMVRYDRIEVDLEETAR